MTLRAVLDPAGAFPVEQYLVALGNPGMAAYFALHGLAKIKTASIISIPRVRRV